MNAAFETVDLSLRDWGKVLEAFEDRTLFQTVAWLSFLKKTQQAEPVFATLRSGGTVLGYFSGLIIRKFGLKILGSPFPGWTTSYMGMNLLPVVSRQRVLEAIIRWAFEELGCAHIEIMDRHLTIDVVNKLELECRRLSSFEIDLTQREEHLWAGMTSACRGCIRKAQKTGVTVEEMHDIRFADEYYAQLQEVFGRQSLVPPYSVVRVRELIRSLGDSSHLLLLRAVDPTGRCIATGIFPAMNGTMYFWGGASWRASLGYRPNEAIHWYAMRYWKARGIQRYDMGGGGEYKRKFGGREISVPWIRASKYRSVASCRELAKWAMLFSRRIRGRGWNVRGGVFMSGVGV